MALNVFESRKIESKNDHFVDTEMQNKYKIFTLTVPFEEIVKMCCMRMTL